MDTTSTFARAADGTEGAADVVTHQSPALSMADDSMQFAIRETLLRRVTVPLWIVLAAGAVTICLLFVSLGFFAAAVGMHAS